MDRGDLTQSAWLARVLTSPHARVRRLPPHRLVYVSAHLSQRVNSPRIGWSRSLRMEGYWYMYGMMYSQIIGVGHLTLADHT